MRVFLLWLFVYFLYTLLLANQKKKKKKLKDILLYPQELSQNLSLHK